MPPPPKVPQPGNLSRLRFPRSAESTQHYYLPITHQSRLNATRATATAQTPQQSYQCSLSRCNAS